MICQRCLFQMQRPSLRGVRNYALKSKANSTHPPNPAKPRGPPTETHEGKPAATSTTAAQPFSARENDPHKTTGSPPILEPSGTADEIETFPREPSSVAAGQPLKGLGYMKNKEPPVALEDHEYPVWLWKLLDREGAGNAEGGALEGNIYSKSKAQRKKALKAARKAVKGGTEELLPQVPIERQSIDLPAGDGTTAGSIEAGNVREEIRQAMRSNRRKQIKDANYLKSMG